ncbi:MAG TPA: transcriptional regulator [Gordonia polyisoprenivorans]|nr:transcriptional regulator [Gordonia polyisoprenivorans]
MPVVSRRRESSGRKTCKLSRVSGSGHQLSAEPTIVTLLDGPWAIPILGELMAGPRRFSQLRDALPGISAHTLTSRLRRFERSSIITRTVHAEVPPRVVYELTALGYSLRPVFDAMNDWGKSVSSATTAGLRQPLV